MSEVAGVLRPDAAQFENLPDYDFAPHYIDIADERLGPLRMHYVDEGPRDAPVVLMLHGNPTWSFLYRHMIGPVAKAGYRVIVPDMLGFGKSDKPTSRDMYSFDRFVAWMRAFVEGLDLTNITLVVQDWGGPIGLRVLSECAERFDAALATNTLLQNCEEPPNGVAGWPGEFIMAWIESCRTSDDLPVDALINRACVSDLSPDVLAAYAAPFPDALSKAGLLQITCGIPVRDSDEGVAANRTAWSFLESWDRPFLTAFSNDDPATIAWEDVFQRRAKGARGQAHARIANAGHFVQEERGEELAAILLRFLNDNAAANAAIAPDKDVTEGNPVTYMNGRRMVQTSSSVLVSSSPWLNDAVIREWISTESLRKNGHDYPLLYGMHQMLTAVDHVRDRQKTEALIAAERKVNPKLDAWFEERFISTFTLDDLAKNPAGSIGRLLYEHMDTLGLSPELLSQRMADPDWAPKSDLDYFTLRSGQTHDFDHLIGEVGFSVMAEIFPTGLRTGNMFAHVSAELAGALMTTNSMIIFPWIMRCMLNYPKAWPTLWRNLSHGYEVGGQSDMLFTVKWEDYLHLSPAEARDALGIRGFKGATSSDEASMVFGEGRLII